MKKNIFFTILGLIGLVSTAQNFSYSFDNATNTTVGMDNFYTVDVILTSDVDATLGEGSFFVNYNTAAFGTGVSNANNLTTNDDPAMGYILGEGAFNNAVRHYAQLDSNDNTPSRFIIFWFQNNSAGTIGLNLQANTPTKIASFTLKYIDVNESPNIEFATFDPPSPFATPVSTACGPFTAPPGGFAQEDCFNQPGQFLTIGSSDVDNSGSDPNAPTSTDYTWADDGNGTAVWTPNNPSSVSTAMDNISIQAPGAIFTGLVMANNLTIDMGADLSLGADALLLSGDATINGTLTAVAGNIQLVGDDVQTFSTTPISGTTVATFNMNNTGAAASVLMGDLNITESLFLNDGELDVTGGTLTLKSVRNGMVTQTAMVGQVTDGSITGDIVVESFIPGKRAFRFVSSPVTTTTSINANYQEGATMATSNPNPGFGTHITGSTTGSNGFDQTGSGAASMFAWENVSQSWAGVSNTNAATLTAGNPYRLFVRGSRATDLTTNSAIADDTNLRTTGSLNVGTTTQSFVTDATEDVSEFMLVGNPYAATVDLRSVATNGGLQNLNSSTYFVWDVQKNTRGGYVTVDLSDGSNTDGSTASEFLISGQSAFYALASTTANTTTGITFQEIDKNLTETTSVLGRNNTVRNRIVAQLKNMNAGLSNPIIDSFKIDFDMSHTNAIDGNDAPKFSNIDENMSTVNGIGNYSIERRAFPINNEVISLDMNNYRASDYVLSINATDFVVPGITAFLQDNFLNTLTEIALGVNDFNITVNNANASGASDRFAIKFQNSVLSNEDIANDSTFSLFPNPVTSGAVTISAASLSGKTVQVGVINSLGQQVYATSLEFNGTTAQLDTFDTLPVGMYIVTITNGEDKMSTKLIKQ